MSFPIQLILAAFATWRITHLLASEDGPGDLIYRMRAQLGTSFAGKLMDCFYCGSVWVAAPLAWMVTRRTGDWFLTWCALSGAACLLERATQRTAAQHELSYEGETSHVLLQPEQRQPEEELIYQRYR
jgi:hypothetical protein